MRERGRERQGLRALNVHLLSCFMLMLSLRACGIRAVTAKTEAKDQKDRDEAVQFMGRISTLVLQHNANICIIFFKIL